MLNMHSSTSSDWIACIPGHEGKIVRELMAAGLDELAAAEFWLSRTGSDSTLGFGAPRVATNYLNSIKAEFRKFVCGDAKYEDLRMQVSEQWSRGKTVIVGVIAVALSSTLGIAVGVLTPVVALLLAIVARVGTNAWCALE